MGAKSVMSWVVFCCNRNTNFEEGEDYERASEPNHLHNTSQPQMYGIVGDLQTTGIQLSLSLHRRPLHTCKICSKKHLQSCSHLRRMTPCGTRFCPEPRMKWGLESWCMLCLMMATSGARWPCRVLETATSCSARS